ncbi:MAG: hypothetical protein H6735_11550 [Alphaproteobacteria bacterium]|nr:hypothetical protein [Alphaproteobacteria bacterium]
MHVAACDVGLARVQEGTRVAGHLVVSGLPHRDGVGRWRAVAEDTGEPAELLVLQREDARARKAFLDAHALLAGLREVGLLRTSRVLTSPRPSALRPPVEDQGLERIRGPLDPATVAWIGATLLPGVLAAHGALGGLIRPEDIGLTSRGSPVLAPLGLLPDRLPREWTDRLAPELSSGVAPDAAAAAYGLGVLLWTLATGRSWQRANPASTPVAPGVLRPGLPAELDTALLQLLGRDPARRAGALPLLQELGRSTDLRTLAARHPATVEVRTTRAPPPPDRVPDPGSVVLVEPGRIAELDAQQRSLLAGLTGLPDTVLQQLATRGLPVVVEGTSGRRAARDRANQLATATGLPVTWGSRAGVPWWLPAAVGAGGGLVALAVGVALAAIGFLPALFVSLIVAGGSLAAGAWVGRQLGRTRALQAAGVTAHRQARALLADHSAGGRLDPAWAALARTRRELGESSLPPAVATDVRAALREIERELVGLADAARTELPGVDADVVRHRLSVLDARPLDEAQRAERDRLARTVADLDAAAVRRERMLASQRTLTDHLDAIGAALAAADDDDDPTALDRLAAVLRGSP